MPRLLVRSAVVLVLVGLSAASVSLLSDARRATARNRELVAANERAGLEVRTRDQALAGARADVAARDERIAFLEAELAGALTRAEEVTRAAAAQREEIERARRELEQRRAETRGPMPEGVRLAIEAIEDCLRGDGHDGIRFVEARGLEEKRLLQVELIERSPDGRTVAYFHADALAVELDRSAGVAVLRMSGGHVVRDGALADFPAEGQELVFRGVHGPTWERRLPFLVAAIGEYPDDPAVGGRSEVMDLASRDRWLARIRTVFAASTTEYRYDLGRFRTVRDARFVDASVHAHEAGRRLVQSAEVRGLAVEVDRATGVVSLLLEDGVLRKTSGETTIPASGYRIPLPGVTPELAIDAMLGFVVYRR